MIPLKKWARVEAAIAMGGLVAEGMLQEVEPSPCWQDDLDNARRWSHDTATVAAAVSRFTFEVGVRQDYEKRGRRLADRFLRTRWVEVGRLAGALQNKRRLNAKHIQALMASRVDRAG